MPFRLLIAFFCIGSRNDVAPVGVKKGAAGPALQSFPPELALGRTTVVVPDSARRHREAMEASGHVPIAIPPERIIWVLDMPLPHRLNVSPHRLQETLHQLGDAARWGIVASQFPACIVEYLP